MPAKSDKQRKYLEATKGHEWVKEHHFDRVAKPDPKPSSKKKPRKK